MESSSTVVEGMTARVWADIQGVYYLAPPNPKLSLSLLSTPQEDLQRGYFDDFREFRDKQGKVFAAEAFAPSKAAFFPKVEGETPDGGAVALPLPQSRANVTLVDVAFRAGAQVGRF